MKVRHVNINVNLAPKDPFFDTGLGKTLRWALGVGRYIVIFTELVVIVSFATRFILDRQVTDLNQAIQQKQSVIQSYGDLEDQVRLAQAKIDNYQQIEQQTNMTEVFPALSAITPRDVKLTELVIKPSSVTLNGTTLSQNSLNLLINNLSLSSDFSNVSVDRIEATKDSLGLNFSVRADIGQAAKPSATPRATNTSPQKLLDRSGGI